MTRITAAEYNAINVKRPKYGNKRTLVDGIKFHSMKEAERYIELKRLVEAGEISHLELQPRFILQIGGKPITYESGRKAEYRADFAYFDGNKRIVEDVKSPATKTQVYKLKRALVEAIYPAVKIIEI